MNVRRQLTRRRQRIIGPVPNKPLPFYKVVRDDSGRPSELQAWGATTGHPQYRSIGFHRQTWEGQDQGWVRPTERTPAGHRQRMDDSRRTRMYRTMRSSIAEIPATERKRRSEALIRRARKNSNVNLYRGGRSHRRKLGNYWTPDRRIAKAFAQTPIDKVFDEDTTDDRPSYVKRSRVDVTDMNLKYLPHRAAFALIEEGTTPKGKDRKILDDQSGKYSDTTHSQAYVRSERAKLRNARKMYPGVDFIVSDDDAYIANEGQLMKHDQFIPLSRRAKRALRQGQPQRRNRRAKAALKNRIKGRT